MNCFPAAVPPCCRLAWAAVSSLCVFLFPEAANRKKACLRSANWIGGASRRASRRSSVKARASKSEPAPTGKTKPDLSQGPTSPGSPCGKHTTRMSEYVNRAYSPILKLSTNPKACHCEPVRTLAWQSVLLQKDCIFKAFRMRIATPGSSVTTFAMTEYLLCLQSLTGTQRKPLRPCLDMCWF